MMKTHNKITYFALLSIMLAAYSAVVEAEAPGLFFSVTTAKDLPTTVNLDPSEKVVVKVKGQKEPVGAYSGFSLRVAAGPAFTDAQRKQIKLTDLVASVKLVNGGPSTAYTYKTNSNADNKEFAFQPVPKGQNIAAVLKASRAISFYLSGSPFSQGKDIGLRLLFSARTEVFDKLEFTEKDHVVFNVLVKGITYDKATKRPVFDVKATIKKGETVIPSSTQSTVTGYGFPEE